MLQNCGSKETLSRALARMKSLRPVENAGRVIRVLHPQRLENWVTEPGFRGLTRCHRRCAAAALTISFDLIWEAM